MIIICTTIIIRILTNMKNTQYYLRKLNQPAAILNSKLYFHVPFPKNVSVPIHHNNLIYYLLL